MFKQLVEARYNLVVAETWKEVDNKMHDFGRGTYWYHVHHMGSEAGNLVVENASQKYDLSKKVELFKLIESILPDGMDVTEQDRDEFVLRADMGEVGLNDEVDMDLVKRGADKVADAETKVFLDKRVQPYLVGE